MLKNNLNILLVTMQLGIGGAETHIVELAKELQRRGHNVIVASNGGEYVRELEECGIKHYKVPLQNKNPLNMLKGRKVLKRIIIEEKIDIVHGHARIPSFILGKIHKSMKFPFVTTAHWVFNTGYGLKYITNWGEKTVAVSEDIKTYLMDNYKIPASDIRVTINGIDTEKFSASTPCEDIKEELGIKDNDTVITYISRLDESRSLAAKQLIEAAEELDREIRNLKVIIVGGGDDFENVRAMADKVNKSLGREAIVLTGGRTDINKLVAPCQLFIGVSRSALEAMAAEKPVIIAGNEGYIGLFDDKKLKIGIDTNFCCRGCEMSSKELIRDDILKFFAMPEEEQKRLGEYGRELIIREYSVGRMADDTLKVYDWALQKNDEILISGYYGFKNSGDDALLSAIIEEIRKYKESPNIVVLSADPSATARRYRVKSINRIGILSILKHMKKGGLLISGGGTLIQNRTSTKSLLYYLAVIRTATKRGMRVMLYANGIGPLRGMKNIKNTRKILSEVDLITLRDESSKKALDDLGIKNKNVVVTADPALALNGDGGDQGKALLDIMGVPNGKKLIGVSVRKWPDLTPGFENIMAEALDYAADKYGYYPVFIPMQMSKDYALSKNICGRMKNPGAVLDTNCDIRSIISLVGEMDMCIGMRLHTLIYSVIKGIPLIGLVYDPKISSFMEYTNQKQYLNVNRLDKRELMKMIDDCESRRDEIIGEITSRYNELKEKAEENGRLAIELYENGSVAL